MSAVGGVGSSTDASHDHVPELPTSDGYAGRPIRPAPSSRRSAGPSQTASPAQDPTRHDDVETYGSDEAFDAEAASAQDEQQAGQEDENQTPDQWIRDFADRLESPLFSYAVDYSLRGGPWVSVFGRSEAGGQAATDASSQGPNEVPTDASAEETGAVPTEAASEATSALTPKDAAAAPIETPAEAPIQTSAAPPSAAGPAVIETEVTRALAGAEQGVTRDWAEQRQRTMDEVRAQFEADQDAAKDAGLFRIVALDESGRPMGPIHDESGAVVSPAPSVFDPAAFKADWLSQPQAGLQALAQQYGLPDQQTLLATRMDVVSLALRGEVGAYEGMPPAGYAMAPPENVQAMDAFLSDPMNQVLILQMGTDPVPPATGPGAREQVRLYGQTRYELLQRLDQAQEKVQADYWQALQAARNDGTHTAAGWHSEQIEQAVTLGTDESGRPIPLTTRDGQPVVETRTEWTLDVQAFSQWYVTQPEVISAQAFGALYGVPHEVAQPMPVDAEGRDLLLYAPPPRLESEVQMSDGSTRRYWIDQDGDVQMDDLLQIDPNDPPQLHSNEAIWFDPALGWVTSTQNRKHGRDVFSMVVTIAVVAVVAYVSAGTLGPAAAGALGVTSAAGVAVVTGAVAGAATTTAAAAVNGGFSWEAVLKAALLGGITAGAGFEINAYASGMAGAEGVAFRVGANAVAGGVTAELAGGDFGDGMLAGALNTGGQIAGYVAAGDAAGAIVGGAFGGAIAAEATGGDGVTTFVSGVANGTASAAGHAHAQEQAALNGPVPGQQSQVNGSPGNTTTTPSDFQPIEPGFTTPANQPSVAPIATNGYGGIHNDGAPNAGAAGPAGSGTRTDSAGSVQFGPGTVTIIASRLSSLDKLDLPPLYYAPVNGTGATQVAQAPDVASRPTQQPVQARPGIFDRIDTQRTFSDAYLRTVPGMKVDGAGDPELRRAMISLQGSRDPRTGDWVENPNEAERSEALQTIARIRGMSVEETERQYGIMRNQMRESDDIAHRRGTREVAFDEQRPDEKRIPLLSLSENGRIPNNTDHMASEQQLRYGQIVGDSVGVDPVFGALMNPTGGIAGAGNIPASPWLTIPAGPEAVLMPHSAAHDAAGYLRNYASIGPGYNYAPTDPWRESITATPTSGQNQGMAYFRDVLFGPPGTGSP